MKILSLIVKAARWAWGNPEDYRGTASFGPLAAALIPAGAGLISNIFGGLFGKSKAKKQAEEQHRQQMQMQQYEMQQRQQAIQDYNTQRQQQVGGRRDMLKAYLTSKGLNTNPFFEHLGGFDNFFSRPISGLQQGQVSAAPIFKPQVQGPGWGDFLQQGLGAGAQALGGYLGARQQNDQFNMAKQNQNAQSPYAGNSSFGASAENPFGQKGQGTDFQLNFGGFKPKGPFGF